MAKKKSATATRTKGAIADLPFYDYLWQFYAGNRREIWRKYTPLTKKFLRFNDPGDDESRKTAYLRKPQYEALEMYVFLKEYCNNARLSNIFKDWQNRKGGFEGRGSYRKRSDELSLFEEADAAAFKEAFDRMAASCNLYANYIFALTMGLGKTHLMATCIYYEFLLARKFPKDTRFCHNALVFAPEKTVLQSLKNIQTFDKSLVVPADYVRKLDDIKFHFLDDTATSLSIQTGSDFNVVITNNQKILLKKVHREKNEAEQLFAVDKKYRSAEEEKKLAENPLAEFYDFDAEAENEEELVANQRFEMLKRLRNLGVYVDEAHHIFGNELEKAFSDKNPTSLRTTINELAKHLAAVGTRVVACYNYTGTPYVKNRLLPEVVYTYSLRDAIDHKYLKLADVQGFANTKDREFVRVAIKDFWDNCGDKRVEGRLPKMALFASSIEELDKKLRPAVEEILTELNIPTSRILRYVRDERLTNDDEREFRKLDLPESEKQFVLLVNMGREGWDCHSLFAVALHRMPPRSSRVFVLQATMRCLRAIGNVQHTGHVYLSEENKAILNKELEENFQMSVDELNATGKKERKPVKVRPVPPPIKLRMKLVSRLYKLEKKEIPNKVLFEIEKYDLEKYRIYRTESDIRRLDPHSAIKSEVVGAKENTHYSAYTLVAEITRNLGDGIGPTKVQEIMENSVEGMDAVLKIVNEFNEVLYDEIIPRLFNMLFETHEYKNEKPVDINLVTLKDGSEYFEFTPKEDLLVEMGDVRFAKYKSKSFHLDNYCFDSNPELSFFGEVIKDEDVDKIWFTGMLTQGQTEFFIRYIDPETHALRSYYPDFLVKMRDGSYRIIEVKGSNMLDDPVVLAKQEYAKLIASENAMTYVMVPDKIAGYGLHPPANFGLGVLWGQTP